MRPFHEDEHAECRCCQHYEPKIAELERQLREAIVVIRRYYKQNYLGGQCVIDDQAKAFLASIERAGRT